VNGVIGYLYVKHKNSCWEHFGKMWPDVTIIKSLITLMGSSTYFSIEFWDKDAEKILNDLLKLLQKDEHTSFIKVVHTSSYGAKLLVTRKTAGVLRAISLTNSLLLGECVIKRGIECYPILVPKHSTGKKLEKLVKEFSSEQTESWFKITNHDEIPTKSLLHQLLLKLTPTEKNVLTTAYELGYFEWPRLHSSAEVAQYLRISNTTFLEHLRKAEKKIIGSLYRYLT